jgi:hypothetical protein
MSGGYKGNVTNFINLSSNPQLKDLVLEVVLLQWVVKVHNLMQVEALPLPLHHL